MMRIIFKFSKIKIRNQNNGINFEQFVISINVIDAG